jgi:hypothetical protein
VLAFSAVSLADDAPAATIPLGLPYFGGYAGYPYALGAPITYTPQLTKLVPKEVEIPVKHIEYGIKETGCNNVFGFPVPCLQDGEARRKRSADEEAAAAPAVLPYLGGLYGGFGYAGLGYGLGLGYGGYAYPQVKIAEPEVTEVEVPHYVYKPVVEKVELAPLCHNGLGFAVPCA